ncbi:hypothetical protein ACQPW3_22915 [Actinosynnema sp. CA-248983]
MRIEVDRTSRPVTAVQSVGAPRAEEVRVSGATALYRRAGRPVGALTVDRPGEVMKYRRRIADRGDWAEAVRFACAGRV